MAWPSASSAAGLRVVIALAVAGVAGQHDPRRAPPGFQDERPGADRMLGDLVAIAGHHLVRQRAIQVIACQHLLHQARPGLLGLELQRVAVERAQAFNGGVVVERCLLLDGGAAQRRQAHQPGIIKARPAGAFEGRIGKAFDAEDEILCGHFAALATEGRVVGKVDAVLEPDGEGLEVGADLGHAIGNQRHDLGGPRQMVVGVKRLENMAGDTARIEVAQLARVEAGLGGAKGVAQDLGLGCRCRWGQAQQAQQDHQAQQAGQAQRQQGLHGCTLRWLLSMSKYSQKFCLNGWRR